jgi:hypothetical protein
LWQTHAIWALKYPQRSSWSPTLLAAAAPQSNRLTPRWNVLIFLASPQSPHSYIGEILQSTHILNMGMLSTGSVTSSYSFHMDTWMHFGVANNRGRGGSDRGVGYGCPRMMFTLVDFCWSVKENTLFRSIISYNTTQVSTINTVHCKCD